MFSVTFDTPRGKRVVTVEAANPPVDKPVTHEDLYKAAEVLFRKSRLMAKEEARMAAGRDGGEKA